MVDIEKYILDILKPIKTKVHDVSKPPDKASSLPSETRTRIIAYIRRLSQLLLLEVEEQVRQFVQTLKDWSLHQLRNEGRVLLDMYGHPAGEYYDGMTIVRFGMKADDAKLPTHSIIGLGDVVTVVEGRGNPLDVSADGEDMLSHGMVIEKNAWCIKVAFKEAPAVGQGRSGTGPFRLDRAVNTITFERAIDALSGLWQIPTPATASGSSFDMKGLTSSLPQCASSSTHSNSNGAHSGAFQGSVLRDTLLADHGSGFRLVGMDSNASIMPEATLKWARPLMARFGGAGASKPDASIVRDLLRQQEGAGTLGSRGRKLQLDGSQTMAVATVIANPISLLHGPPGTGKTTTIEGLLFMLRRWFGFKGTALVVAQSNVAVDNVLEGALLQGGLKVIRIGEPVRVRGPLKHRTLRVLVDQEMRADAAMAQLYKRRTRLLEEMNIVKRKQEEYSARVQRRSISQQLGDIKAELHKRMKAIERRLLEGADVVGATCTGSGGPELQDYTFDLVVLDEGSQCSEPEALIPIMKGAKQLVLVGDHKQLPPVVQSRQAEAGGLGTSLFERLLLAGAPSAMLQVQYRAHPSLAAFSNTHFYDDMLVNGVSAADRPPPPFPLPSSLDPIMFVDVPGQEAASMQGSKSNEAEAKLLVACVQLLVQQGMSVGSMGVVSPYAAQVGLICKLLPYKTSSKAASEEDSEVAAADVLEVKSVDGYQGREKEVILLSAVRANSRGEVGFLSDQRRLNVAITRARRGLLVFGHSATLSSNSTWGAYLAWLRARDCVVSAEELTTTLQAMLKAVQPSTSSRASVHAAAGASSSSGGGSQQAQQQGAANNGRQNGKHGKAKHRAAAGTAAAGAAGRAANRGKNSKAAARKASGKAAGAAAGKTAGTTAGQTLRKGTGQAGTGKQTCKANKMRHAKSGDDNKKV